MIKKLLRKLFRPVVGKTAAAVIAAEVDEKAKKVLDKQTGGLASKIDKVV